MAVRLCYGKRRIRAVQMDNLRSLFGIRRMDRVPNAQIRELDIQNIPNIWDVLDIWDILDESGTDRGECSRKVTGVNTSLVSTRDLQLECARILNETLLVPVVMCGSETML